MNKVKSFFNKLPNIFKGISTIFHARSMSTQLIITIVLLFSSFFFLQSILNSQFFGKFYTQQEFNNIHTDLIDYVDSMNEEDADFYDLMYDFTTNANAYTVITSGDFRPYISSDTNFTIDVKDSTNNETYRVLIPNNTYDYTIDENISMSLYVYNEEFYSPATINTTGNIYSNSSICTHETCILVTGKITEINKPDNLNYMFADNNIVNQELIKLSGNFIDIGAYEYEYGYWYKSEDGPFDTLIFIHELEWDYIVTIIPIENPQDIISIISTYNYYVYMTAIAILFLWSFRLSSIITKPVQSIELVAKEISNLNFNVEAHEYNNRENASLTRSINLISRNLKDTLATLNNRNQEMTRLYDDQTKQVTLKKQLVSSISHELKTPLMIMQVTIQGILDGVIPEEDQQSELLNVVEEINKSSIMIQDMLQIYRLDDAQSELEISEFSLSNCIYVFIEDFDNVIKNHNLKINLNVKKDVMIEADNKLIKRVISNFFTNAIKYTPENQQIDIEISETKNQAYFELINYGATIDPNNLENIWMPFFRGEPENTSNRLKTKGTGIGLYLVSEILKAHNCEFGIENVKNGVKSYFYINKKVE
jgi:signal transduction histidine kinase